VTVSGRAIPPNRRRVGEVSPGAQQATFGKARNGNPPLTVVNQYVLPILQKFREWPAEDANSFLAKNEPKQDKA